MHIPEEFLAKAKVLCARRRRKDARRAEIRAPENRPNYHEYLRSEKWKKKRLRALKSAGFRCNICKCDGPLQVHHKTYRRLGFERLRDLQVVCGACHKKIHGIP